MNTDPERLVKKLPEIYYAESQRRFYAREADVRPGKKGNRDFISLTQFMLRLHIQAKCKLDKNDVRLMVFWLMMNRRVREARRDRDLQPGVHQINHSQILILQQEKDLRDWRRKYEVVRGRNGAEWIGKYRQRFTGEWITIAEIFKSPMRAREAAKLARNKL